MTADEMLDAALALSHAMQFEEAVTRYLDVAQRFPQRACECARAIGDCRLHAVELGVAATEHAAAFVEDALEWYERALALGARRRILDESYFSAVELLESHAPGSDVARKAVDRYVRKFPNGQFAGRAMRMRDGSGVVRLSASA